MNPWTKKEKMKKRIRHDLIDLADDALHDDGWEAGREMGLISDEERDRTYHLLTNFIYRTAEHIVEMGFDFDGRTDAEANQDTQSTA